MESQRPKSAGLSKIRAYEWLIILTVLVQLVGLALGFQRSVAFERQMASSLQALKSPDYSGFGLAVGSPAPTFETASLNGARVSSQDFAGKGYLMVFASPSCPSCQDLFPALSALRELDDPPGLVLIAYGDEDDAQSLLSPYGLDTVALKWDDAIRDAYRVRVVPFMYLIDEEGLILNAGSVSRLSELKAFIEQVSLAQID